MDNLKQLLLLIQDQRDVDALPGAAVAYASQGYNGLWVLFSPAVLVDTATASAEHDKNIKAREAQIDQCVARRDFAGAREHQIALDAAILEKTAKVKEAWRTLTPDAQKAATERVFGAFFDALPKERVRPEQMREHYEANEFIAALNAIKKGWFAPYTPGDFTLTWARELAKWKWSTSAPTEVKPNPHRGEDTNFVKPTKAKTERPPLPTQHPRFKELVLMSIDDIGAHALSLGINPNGMQLLKLRHSVFKAEKARGLVKSA